MPSRRGSYQRKRDGVRKTPFSIWIDSRYEEPLKKLALKTGESANAVLVKFCERGGLKKLLANQS